MNPFNSPLLTDLYQLTMVQSYLEHDMQETAVYEFFVRRLPTGRNFLVAAGLAQVLDFLDGFHFEPEELQWLAKKFPPHMISWLEQIRFSGDVYALQEGTLFFPDEPILRIVAPLPLAQLIESRVINLLHFETLIASKAARSVLVAPDKLLVDFGLRRAHAGEAGLLAARAGYLAGYSGSATVLAGKLYDVPIFGTMAHSFIQAHEDEVAAFEHFARSHPDNVFLLIDTYDTEAAAGKVVELTRRLEQDGIAVKGVRIDSGDLAAHAHKVRHILDEGGLQKATIFASGNLDEYQLQQLLAAGAPIDGFGVGTALDTSSDAPSLDCAYKLQEYAGMPRRKRSEGKATWPGRKQVYRRYDAEGRMTGDTVALDKNDLQEGEPLLRLVMRDGKRTGYEVPLDALREKTLDSYKRLPLELHRLETTPAYPVGISSALRDLADQVDKLHMG